LERKAGIASEKNYELFTLKCLLLLRILVATPFLGRALKGNQVKK
jgi:hypothetical protein